MTLEPYVYSIQTDKSTIREIKIEIARQLKDTPIGSKCTYTTKKGVTLGVVTPSGIKITKI